MFDLRATSANDRRAQNGQLYIPHSISLYVACAFCASFLRVSEKKTSLKEKHRNTREVTQPAADTLIQSIICGDLFVRSISKEKTVPDLFAFASRIKKTVHRCFRAHIWHWRLTYLFFCFRFVCELIWIYVDWISSEVHTRQNTTKTKSYPNFWFFVARILWPFIRNFFIHTPVAFVLL